MKIAALKKNNFEHLIIFFLIFIGAGNGNPPSLKLMRARLKMVMNTLRLAVRSFSEEWSG